MPDALDIEFPQPRLDGGHEKSHIFICLCGQVFFHNTGCIIKIKHDK